MPTERFGTTQVKEVRITHAEAVKILSENIRERAGKTYDFDYDRPILVMDHSAFLFRFVQRVVVHDTDEKQVFFKPLKEKSD